MRALICDVCGGAAPVATNPGGIRGDTPDGWASITAHTDDRGTRHDADVCSVACGQEFLSKIRELNDEALV